MFAKIKKRSDFGGVVNYANDPKKNAEIIGSNGVLLTDNRTITDSFEVQLNLADEKGKVHRVRDPVRHVPISFSPQDAKRFEGKYGNDFMMKLVKEWMEGLEIDPEDTQYIVVRHYDKEHPHCHLIFNRINNHGRVISDKHDQYRNVQVCKKIKKAHDLTFGDPMKPKVKKERLRGSDKLIQEIKEAVAKAYKESADWKEFHAPLNKVGVKMTIKVDTQSQKIRGVIYEKNGTYVSGSKLAGHGKFAFGNLSLKFGTLEKRVRPISLVAAYQADIRTSRNGKETYLPGRVMLIAQRGKLLVPGQVSTRQQEPRMGVNREWELNKRKTMEDDIDDEVSHGMKW